MTKDERFLIEIYRKLKESDRETCNPEDIALELGYNTRLMNNILKGLMQANLVKRYTPDEITLTPRGFEVARSLLV